jgi:chaperone LolA
VAAAATLASSPTPTDPAATPAPPVATTPAAAATPAAAGGVAATAPAPTPAPESAGDEVARLLLEKLQARYDATASLRLNFIQRYTNRATGRTLEDSGSIASKKPGRMRWEYKDPEKLYVLADGVSWFYVPEDEVVYRIPTGPDEARRLPALLLAGQASFGRDFKAHLDAVGPPARLRLEPTAGDEDYAQVLLAIDPATLELRSLAVVDVLGNLTEYEFQDEQRNVDLPDELFRFKAPPGVEVVER